MFAVPVFAARPLQRRAKFRPEEDAKLKELVERSGTISWDVVAREMPGRNARQCRERWKHYVSSTRPKGEWSLTEDLLLYQKMEEIGPRWTNLAQFFPGRTDLQVKTRWMHRFASVSNLHLRRIWQPDLMLSGQPLIFAASMPPPPEPQVIIQDSPVQFVHVIHWAFPQPLH
jgi:hypothetical protein